MTLLKKKLDSFPFVRHSFDDFNTRDLFLRDNFNGTLSLPAVNITETNDAFFVEMAAPGLQKKDFSIELDNEILKISAHHERKEESDDSQYVRKEYNYTSFERTFHLPKSIIDDSLIKAEYNSGILKIAVAKREEAKALPPRNIPIK